MDSVLNLDLNQEKKPYFDKAAELKAEYQTALEESKNADNENEEVRLHSPCS